MKKKNITDALMILALTIIGLILLGFLYSAMGMAPLYLM